MKIKAGKINDLSNSLAADIENAFMKEWGNVMKDENGNSLPTPNSNKQMQLLFIAVAQGVVKHLKMHQDSIVITHVGHIGETYHTEINIEPNSLLNP
jgi:hypothetical protein